jgi:hypothetical protein
MRASDAKRSDGCVVKMSANAIVWNEATRSIREIACERPSEYTLNGPTGIGVAQRSPQIAGASDWITMMEAVIGVKITRIFVSGLMIFEVSAIPIEKRKTASRGSGE